MAVFGIDELPVKPRMRGWIHLWAFAVSVVAGIVLVTLAATVAEPPAGIATAIYSLTVCGVFGVSALYHRVHWHDRPRRACDEARRPLDDLPVHRRQLHTVRDPRPPTGHRPHAPDRRVVGRPGRCALKMLWPTAPRWVGVPLYLLLGWAIVPVAGTVVDEAGLVPMLLLLIGGILYSVGAVLYATKWPNPWPHTFGHHEFFHAATVLAALCHAVAVWLVVFA